MGKNNSKMEFGTKAVHGGKIRDEYGSLVTPIYLTTSYIFDDVADGAKKCESHDNGHCYTRISNPTQDAFEQKIAELEGGEAALAFASGTAAVSSLLLYKFQQGDHAVVDNTSYSSTQFLFDSVLRKFGVETTFVDMSNIENLKDAIKENTKMIFFESPANPTLKLVDIEAVAKIGKEKGIMTAIDNTFASPYIQNPLNLGIDVVMHSATKYICGHGDAVAGVLVGTKKLMDEIRDYSIKNIGAIISPFNSYLLVRGLKTLSVRMQKHCSNAMAVAEFLEKHPKVDRVYYPGLPSHPQHELAKKQMRDFGAIICFELKGGIEQGVTLMESVEMCTLAVSVGDCETLVEHPASMTHWYIPKEEREKAGIADGFVRLSLGIEEPEDIIEDLRQALDKVII